MRSGSRSGQFFSRRAHDTEIDGNLLAAMLASAWRRSAPCPQFSARELTRLAPLLLHSGAAALGWWRVLNSDLRRSTAALELEQAYRLYTLQGAIHELEVKKMAAFVQSLNLQVVLGKGWAIARLYPEFGLRPYGDLDLYVRPEQYSTMIAALSRPEAEGCPVDLHRGAPELDDRSFDELYARSQLVRRHNVKVRIFGPEDHLRLLSLHMLRHGAWRPLWLFDIAVALERRPAEFDWDYFLSGNRRRTDWVRCAIGLAHQLLGARVDDTPVEWRAKHLPKWLVPTVLRQWGRDEAPQGTRTGMAEYLRKPTGLFRALRLRWPNAIEGTVGMRGPFNELPRLPFQIGDALFRTAKFLTQVPRSLRQQYRARA